jgi:anaerobic selenocysteine-containing dehydrogenase
MDRRSFIKLTAVTGTTATLAACSSGSPENQLIRFVPDDEIVPGIATFKPSVCPLCQSGCGLTVRVMDADVDTARMGQTGVIRMNVAKKLEGNSAHPNNRGGLCARGQAAIQVTYHPDRITQPLKRKGNRGAGSYDAITWEAAIAELTGKLDALAGAGNQKALAALVRPGNSRRRALVDQFLARFGAPAPVAYELFGDEVLRQANARSFGVAQLPTIDLGRTQYAISFGADFLGMWGAPVAQQAAYGAMRQGRPGQRGSFVQVEARMSLTGANADEWVPAAPGTEGVLALGLANVIMSAKLRAAGDAGRAGAAIDGWSAGLADYTPEKVQAITGVQAARIERLARAFVERRPAVAFIGGAALAHTNGLFNALAVNALNALAGSVNQPGGLFFTPQAYTPAARTLQPFAAAALAGSDVPQVLLVDGANPVFTAPTAWKVRDALDKVPYIVSFSSFLDETGALADLILPDHSFLEGWTDALPESGSLQAVASVAGPVMRPLYQTRATGDVLLEVGRALAKPVDLPWQTYDEMLKASFDGLPAAEGSDAWTAAQTQGGWWGDLPAARQATPAVAAAGAVAYAAAQFDGDPQQYPFHFLPYESTLFGDGATAHLPWLQEQPDPQTSAMWRSWIEINPSTAARLGIGQGDVVDVTSSQGTLRAPAHLSPGIAPDVIAMPAGQGHQMFTRYASGRGQSPVPLLAPVVEPVTGAPAWAATRVKVARVADPDGSLILFAGDLRDRQEFGR